MNHRGPRSARLLLLLVFPALLAASDRPDLTVADFEGEHYAGWIAEGTAFGPGPARGTLPGQMAVSGFEGRGLVNSFLGGDDATGTLTSPPFAIDRPSLNFLIGGGRFPGETCMDLLVDGAVVRSATGPNDRPGGSERLDWASWDVAEFAGRKAVLRVVDRRKGGWGHINVDSIIQSDRRFGIAPATRGLAADRRYLLIPVRTGAPIRRVRVAAEGRVVREFDVELADGPPGFVTSLDLGPFRGKALTLSADLPSGSDLLGRIETGDDLPDSAEGGRPRFHFTSRRGWLNDPNGLVWLDGEYHLFYQHNPYGWAWGNMHWGHAVSPDLVRWRELPIALYPRRYGDWAFSGSAVVDRGNTSGFGTAEAPPMVLAYTSTGRGECIASSQDRGRTWTEFAGNPVVRHEGRDPRLLRHGPTGRWVMAVYDEGKERQSIAFHSSPDLKTWTFESRIDGFFECPDLFELPVVGEPGRSFWVLSAADGEYLLGRFDGHRFEPEPGGKLRTWHGDFYAAQTFSNTPDGRRVQIGWARGIAFPGKPFNQQMTFPCELTLVRTEDGPRLTARPVAELATLRRRSREFRDVGPGLDVLAESRGDLFEVRAEAEVGPTGGFTLTAHGTAIAYDSARRTLRVGATTAPLAPVDGVVRLQVLVDRGSVEVFADDGRVAVVAGTARVDSDHPLGSSGGRFRSIAVHELESARPGPIDQGRQR